jgi:polysaccharide deacetylase 2 family uncharacterized protein YibQ
MNKYKVFVIFLLFVVAIETVMLFILWPKEKGPLPRREAPLRREAKGKRIAIVLDDWGYNVSNVPAIQDINAPLTISVLPRLPYSKAVAEALYRKGFEIILHLPLEPREKYNLEKDTITTSMNAETIEQLLSKQIMSVPHIKGVSNHMGSRVTADQRVMAIILEGLKKRRLYFLDSYVTSQSVCRDLARGMHVGFAQRDIFIDNSSDPAYIKGQMLKLQKQADARGYAVGIGHDRKNTIAVLKEMIPLMQKEGYSFVFVSDLLKR